MSKVALITGIRGQDAAYLAALLLSKGYAVWGADRRGAEPDRWRLLRLGIEADIRFVTMDVTEPVAVLRTIASIGPDEVYNLAAQSVVSASYEQPGVTTNVNAVGALHVLQASRALAGGVRVFQASTSEMFGAAPEVPQNEQTRIEPRSPYAAAKAFAHWMTVAYRETHGLFACSGILFNHESPLRGSHSVTRKICAAAARIARGSAETLVLGNLDSRRDWGAAAEHMLGAWLMLQQPAAGDYVLATGRAHSVEAFVDLAFACIGLPLRWEGAGVERQAVDRDGRLRVAVSRDLYRPSDVALSVGDASKARRVLGWEPKASLEDLVKLMVHSELEQLEQSESGDGLGRIS